MNKQRKNVSQKRRPHNFWCSICGGNFARVYGLRQHILKKHDDVTSEELNSPLTQLCEHCDAAFHRKVALEKHIILQHVKYDDVSIASCCDEYTDPEQLKAHKLLAHKTRQAPKTMPVRYKKCRICKEEHHSRRMYTHHVQNHPEVPYTIKGIVKLCDLCGKGCKSRLEYEDHMNIHYGVRPYECSVCGASFSSRVGANTHLQRHGPRTYRCEHCGKSFYTSTARAAHLRIHTGDRKYRCETCDKGFLHAASLRYHVDGVHNKIRRVKKKPTSKRERTSQNEISQDDSSQSQDDYVIVKVEKDNKKVGGRKKSVKKKREELDEHDYDREEQNEDFDQYELEKKQRDELDVQIFEQDELVKEEHDFVNQDYDGEEIVYEDDSQDYDGGEIVQEDDNQDFDGGEIVQEDHDELDQTDDSEELMKNVPKVETQVVYFSDEGENINEDIFEIEGQDGENLICFVHDHANEEIVESVNIE